MASTSAMQEIYQPAQNSSPHQCKECGLFLNSAESLEVHLQYHKENLINKWGNQGTTLEETNNNNNTKNIKREFIVNSNTIAAPADSSDAMSMKNKSPDYSRATPDSMYASPTFPHHDNAFSPGYHQNFTQQQQQNTQQIKSERASPFQSYGAYPPTEQFQNYSPEFAAVQRKSLPAFRYHPYQQGQYERPNSQVSSSSPAYHNTPSPSPRQCDKCGFISETAAQMNEHISLAHPHNLNSFQNSFMPQFGGPDQPPIKEEDAQSEILDLDSHKVHHFGEEDVKPPQEHNPHSVTAMLGGQWSPQQPQQNPQEHMFVNAQAEQEKMFHHNQPAPQMHQNKLFAQQQPNPPQIEQKLFQPHMMPPNDYMNNGVTTTTQENGLEHHGSPNQTYRPFEHSLPTQPMISSSQIPANNQVQSSGTPSTNGGTKAASWKSNEARRPKTYNCTACNKWFTSSGHLKRHYNTTLHKNAVKSSGQPDPATLPISAHHHPARDPPNTSDRSSNSPNEELRGEESNGGTPPLMYVAPMQQPPIFDTRQPANIHQPSPLPSPIMQQQPSNFSQQTTGSPPNGEAGLSAVDSRGLLSLATTPTPMQHGIMGHHTLIPAMGQSHLMEAQYQQMHQHQTAYPNGVAPHVTSATISNLSITGEQYMTEEAPQQQEEQQSQPLPSFAQFRYGSQFLVNYGANPADVGGGLVPVTAPYSFYATNPEHDIIFRQHQHPNEDYKLTILTSDYQNSVSESETILPCSPSYQVLGYNNNVEEEMDDSKIDIMDELKVRLEAQPTSPEKARTKRDYEDTTHHVTSTSNPNPAKKPKVQNQVSSNGVHKCFDCDKIFNKACYLTQHNKTFHSGDKPFKCTRCGKRFSCEVTHTEHLSKHAGDKPHKCDLCPKQFNHKTDLRRHMCLHTGQKPYSCETCGKGFIRKDHMIKHMEVHTRKAQLKSVMR